MWPAGKRQEGVVWMCSCECGVYKPVSGTTLRNGSSISCGCYRKELSSRRAPRTTHGYSYSRTYKTWVGMKSRCNNPNSSDYPRYGGSGVSICDRWRDFRNFLADMGPRPEGKTLDRYPDKTGNYEPGNCRWATPEEQSQNQITTKLTPEKIVDIRTRRKRGESNPALANEYGISKEMVSLIACRKVWRNVA